MAAAVTFKALCSVRWEQIAHVFNSVLWKNRSRLICRRVWQNFGVGEGRHKKGKENTVWCVKTTTTSCYFVWSNMTSLVWEVMKQDRLYSGFPKGKQLDFLFQPFFCQICFSGANLWYADLTSHWSDKMSFRRKVSDVKRQEKTLLQVSLPALSCLKQLRFTS